MAQAKPMYDLIVKGGRVIDPANKIDAPRDVGVKDGRIAAVEKDIARGLGAQTLDISGSIVIPGAIDLHTHIFEWLTGFALNGDDLGVHSGITTAVAMGDVGAFTIEAFKRFIVSGSKTHLLCFPGVYGNGIIFATPYPHYFHPDTIDIEDDVKIAAEYPELVKGFKIHGDAGSLSRFGTKSIEKARTVGDKTGLPLYMHTGFLLEVVKGSSLKPETVIDIIPKFLKAGDILAHPFAFYPDGLLWGRDEVPGSLREALDRGVLLDLGRGHHLSIALAEKMIPKGIFPYTFSSDTHGTVGMMHDETALDYSLFGTLSLFLALGIDLNTLIERITINPARVLRMENEIGTLGVGTRADITVFNSMPGKWVFRDRLRKTIEGKDKLVPIWVVREGEVIQPNRRLMRDLEAA